MARYVTLHTLGCLTRQGAEELCARLHGARGVTSRRALADTVEGKMLVEWEASDRERLEGWLRAERFTPDWVLRIEYESVEGRLVSV